MSWQPISTAPMDGTRILVCIAGRAPIISRYSISERFENGALDYRHEGWVVTHFTGLGEKYQPTHWCAIPEPPEAADEAQAA